MAEQIREWVRAAVAHANVTPTELARAAGLSHTTITNYLASPPGTRMRITSLRKIAAASGLPLPESIDPMPPGRQDVADLALAIGDLLPRGKALGDGERAHILREILALIERRDRARGRGR